MSRILFAGSLAVLAVSCAVYQTSDVCEPGEREPCACVGDAVGEKSCLPGGRGWGDCECDCAYAWCGGECTDTSTDPGNCGECDRQCGAGEACEDGRCVEDQPECPPGLDDCSGVCVDLARDVRNCGACGATCRPGQDCIDGACAGCTPDCTGRECGPEPVCGVSCGSCPSGEVCNARGLCEGCVPDCTNRECGLDPVCGLNCGNCRADEVCRDGACIHAEEHPGAGDYCNDQDETCPEGPGTADTCLITNEPDPGDGFCSFVCVGDDEFCRADFTDGCCLDVSGQGDHFCMPSDYCEQPCTDCRGYLEECGEAGFDDCEAGLFCILISAGEAAVCLYPCDYPDGACPDFGTCVEVPTADGVCIPPGDRGHGELCQPVFEGCLAGLDCLMFEGTEYGYCSAQCNCSTGTGCPEGNPAPMCMWTNQQQTTCWCGYACPGELVTDCPGGGEGWTCVNVGSTQPFWACLPQ